MKNKISYIILSSLTLSLLLPVSSATAKSTASKSAPAPRVAYSSPPAKAAPAGVSSSKSTPPPKFKVS